MYLYLYLIEPGDALMYLYLYLYLYLIDPGDARAFRKNTTRVRARVTARVMVRWRCPGLQELPIHACLPALHSYGTMSYGTRLLYTALIWHCTHMAL